MQYKSRSVASTSPLSDLVFRCFFPSPWPPDPFGFFPSSGRSAFFFFAPSGWLSGSSGRWFESLGSLGIVVFSPSSDDSTTHKYPCYPSEKRGCSYYGYLCVVVD